MAHRQPAGIAMQAIARARHQVRSIDDPTLRSLSVNSCIAFSMHDSNNESGGCQGLGVPAQHSDNPTPQEANMLVWDDEVKTHRKSQVAQPFRPPRRLSPALPRMTRRAWCSPSATVTRMPVPPPFGGCRQSPSTRRASPTSASSAARPTSTSWFRSSTKWAWEKYLATCANHWMPQESTCRATSRRGRTQRPDRRRAPHRQAQPRLLRHRRLAGRQQHRAGHLPPHHGARVPPVPAAPGLRGSDPHHAYQYIVESLGLDEARSSTPITRSRRSATRTSS